MLIKSNERLNKRDTSISLFENITAHSGEPFWVKGCRKRLNYCKQRLL
ncbi:hypothetical protein VCHA37P200_140070 [Vibrio chagasii]|nr:hypothetical protein VCHA53O468_120048 [Vibrio chagasii]CAH7152627.1 hypothetical protein VCHA37P200_140070 [Vibrio chagasii]CAH7186271.1 hypothetical protein VCHA37P191_270047 [Vibrio chagasii]